MLVWGVCLIVWVVKEMKQKEALDWVDLFLVWMISRRLCALEVSRSSSNHNQTCSIFWNKLNKNIKWGQLHPRNNPLPTNSSKWSTLASNKLASSNSINKSKSPSLSSTIKKSSSGSRSSRSISKRNACFCRPVTSRIKWDYAEITECAM